MSFIHSLRLNTWHINDSIRLQNTLCIKVSSIRAFMLNVLFFLFFFCDFFFILLIFVFLGIGMRGKEYLISLLCCCYLCKYTGKVKQISLTASVPMQLLLQTDLLSNESICCEVSDNWGQGLQDYQGAIPSESCKLWTRTCTNGEVKYCWNGSLRKPIGLAIFNPIISFHCEQ